MYFRCSVPRKYVRVLYQFKWFLKLYDLSYSYSRLVPWGRKSQKPWISTYTVYIEFEPFFYFSSFWKMSQDFNVKIAGQLQCLKQNTDQLKNINCSKYNRLLWIESFPLNHSQTKPVRSFFEYTLEVRVSNSILNLNQGPWSTASIHKKFIQNSYGPWLFQ